MTNELIKALNKTEETLLVDLALAVSPKKLGTIPPTLEELIKYAKAWLASKKDKLALILCGNEKFQQALKQGRQGNRVELAAVILDIIATPMMGLPVVTISALITKEVAFKLCEDFTGVC